MRSPRPFIYLLGLLLPPLIIGTTLTFLTLSQLMIRKAPPPYKGSLPAAPELSKNSKLRAVILTSNVGTEITDLLGPLNILAESDAFDVYTVAPERRFSPTTADVSFLPDFDLSQAPQADLIVLPSVLDFENPILVDWLKKHAPKAQAVLALSEGARIAAQAGLFRAKIGTAFFTAIEDLKQLEPTARWLPNARYVVDGPIISTSSITGGLDATLQAIEIVAGQTAAQRATTRLNLVRNQQLDPYFSEPKSVELAVQKDRGWGDVWGSDGFFQLFMRGGYDWNKRRTATLLYPGVSELGLAASLETMGRSFRMFVSVASATRVPIRTQHGMILISNSELQDIYEPHLFVIPPGASDQDLLADPALKQWLSEAHPLIKDFKTAAAGQSFQQSFALLAELEGDPLAQFVGRTLDFPASQIKPVRPRLEDELALWLRPLLVGLLGMWAVWVGDRWLKGKAEEARRITQDTRLQTADAANRA